MTGRSRLSAPTQAPSLPSLSRCTVGRAVGAVSLARVRSLSLCPTVPTCQLVSNLSPTISLPWTRPRPLVLRPRPSPRTVLAHLPSLICALCAAPSPTLSLCPHEPRAPPPPADAHRLFRGRRCGRAPSSATVSFALPSATRDTLQCALSLPTASSPRSPESFFCAAGVRHRHPVEPLRLCRCFATPALLLEVSNLLMPLIWLSSLYSSRDCSPEQSSATVSLLRRGLRRLVPLCQREGHGRVCQTALITPRLVPEPLVPRRGRSARLR